MCVWNELVWNVTTTHIMDAICRFTLFQAFPLTLIHILNRHVEVHVLGSNGYWELLNISDIMFLNNLLGELAFGFVVVDSITGDSRKLPASVVLIMDVIRHVLEVLHVGSDTKHLILKNSYITLQRSHKVKTVQP